MLLATTRLAALLVPAWESHKVATVMLPVLMMGHAVMMLLTFVHVSH